MTRFRSVIVVDCRSDPNPSFPSIPGVTRWSWPDAQPSLLSWPSSRTSPQMDLVFLNDSPASPAPAALLQFLALVRRAWRHARVWARLVLLNTPPPTWAGSIALPCSVLVDELDPAMFSLPRLAARVQWVWPGRAAAVWPGVELYGQEMRLGLATEMKVVKSLRCQEGLVKEEEGLEVVVTSGEVVMEAMEQLVEEMQRTRRMMLVVFPGSGKNGALAGVLVVKEGKMRLVMLNEGRNVRGLVYSVAKLTETPCLGWEMYREARERFEKRLEWNTGSLEEKKKVEPIKVQQQRPGYEPPAMLGRAPAPAKAKALSSAVAAAAVGTQPTKERSNAQRLRRIVKMHCLRMLRIQDTQLVEAAAQILVIYAGVLMPNFAAATPLPRPLLIQFVESRLDNVLLNLNTPFQ